MNTPSSIPDSPQTSSAPEVIIYIDGSVEPNPSAGGIGAVLIFGKHQREISEAIGRATNNTAEIQAAITALNALTKTCHVTIYSDSQYLIETMNGNYSRKTNLDLWRDLDLASLRHDIEWKWVRGHDGNPNNERAHQLAYAGMRKEWQPS